MKASRHHVASVNGETSTHSMRSAKPTLSWQFASYASSRRSATGRRDKRHGMACMQSIYIRRRDVGRRAGERIMQMLIICRWSAPLAPLSASHGTAAALSRATNADDLIVTPTADAAHASPPPSSFPLPSPLPPAAIVMSHRRPRRYIGKSIPIKLAIMHVMNRQSAPPTCTDVELVDPQQAMNTNCSSLLIPSYPSPLPQPCVTSTNRSWCLLIFTQFIPQRNITKSRRPHHTKSSL